MSGIDIFEDDWRDCLRAHYAHVIREQDTNNERSLITVLAQTGFTESQIEAMHQEIVVELGWAEPAPQIELQEAQVAEADPEPQAAPLEEVETFETGPLVVEAVMPESLPVLEAAFEESVTLLEEEIAEAELTAQEEAILASPEVEQPRSAAPEPLLLALELPMDASEPPTELAVPSQSAPDAEPHPVAPLPERKPEKKKPPKKTQQMSLF